MAITLVAHVAAQSTNQNTVTTAGIDTTNASLLVVCVVQGSTANDGISDSKGNTWTVGADSTANGLRARFYFVASPTVGTGHTFTLSDSGSFPTIFAAAFSGALAASPKDQQNGTGGLTLTTLQPGSITPTQDNEVLVTGVLTAVNTATPTIDS